MKLELKHIAPYLPYGLRFDNGRDYEKDYLYGIRANSYNVKMAQGGDCGYFRLEKIKPILRPLSDLTKEITVNGKTFVPLHKFYSLTSVDLELIDLEEWREELVYLIKNNSPFQLSQFNMLLEWHFDVFGLIERGLAIDINTIK